MDFLRGFDSLIRVVSKEQILTLSVARIVADDRAIRPPTDPRMRKNLTH